MASRRVLIIAALASTLATGCFSPRVSCGQSGACPDGQLCDLDSAICLPAESCVDCRAPFVLAAEHASQSPNPDDEFGFAVAAASRAFAVGAWGDDGVGGGAAYFYQRNGDSWEATRASSPDTAPGDQYGFAVAVADEFAAVGAPGADLGGAGSGGVYVYERESDGEVKFDTRIPGAVAGDRFGCAVALHDAVLAVGACTADGAVADTGQVSIYEHRAGVWSSFGSFVPNDAEGDQRFGSAVAVADGVLAVGASGDGDRGGDAGAVYVFEKQPDGNWRQAIKLTASDGSGGDLFGTAVAVSENIVVVGAYRHDDPSENAGAVYVFERDDSAWIETAKLTAEGGAEYDLFGFSVAVAGDVIVVGARWTDDRGEDAGSVYIYERRGTGWVEFAEIVAPGDAGDGFGFAVAADGDTLISAAYPEQAAGNSGTAYVFERADR